jgi:alkylhydroperoxidase/carboxymuconolactone decarboxylase family protein YurZ
VTDCRSQEDITMAISDAARRNHEELFPGHISTLTVTDPELIEYFSLGGCEPQAKGHVSANRNVGNNRDVLLAVITQLLPFIGYPRSLNALRVLNEVTSR